MGRGSTFFVDLPIYGAKELTALNGIANASVSFSDYQLLWPSPAPLLNHISDFGLAQDSYHVASEAALGGQAEDQVAAPSSSSLQSDANFATQRLRTRILIVDDSSMNR